MGIISKIRGLRKTDDDDSSDEEVERITFKSSGVRSKKLDPPQGVVIPNDTQFSVTTRFRKRIKHPVTDTRENDLGDYYIFGVDKSMHDKCFRCDKIFVHGDEVYLEPAKTSEVDLDVVSPFPYCETCTSKEKVKDIL